ncbi:MAG TPA: acylphosphatase [Gemmatimonadaceae bacterium]|nr:acylphosphatase [Gemmatimonadaceae bacterium]
MTVHLEVVGVVQGVGFRWFARELAQRLGLAGWVRNRQDGVVEIAAMGDEAAVERFVTAMRRGPSGARVDEVRSLPTESLGTLPHPFAISR